MSLPFNPKKGLIIVPTRLWGPRGDTLVRLALDTGATGSLVSWDAMMLLGYDPAIVPGRIQMTTGSGMEFVPRISVEKIEAIGQDRQNFLVLCHTLPSRVILGTPYLIVLLIKYGVPRITLGLDFFRERQLIIDFRTGLVTVK